jgi:hypothetical protein
MSPTDPPSPARRDPALLVVLGVVGVLVLVALIVVFTRGQPALLAAGTPGGVVQRYSAAVLAGDEAAAGYLTDEASKDCDGSHPSTPQDMRVTLLGTTERDRSADVRVSIVTSYNDGLFGPNEYAAEETFSLVSVDGEWMIDQPPWQLLVCPTGPLDTP